MTQTPHSPVLAIDGGGTRCRFALQDGTTVTQIEVGSANVSTDFDGAIAEIVLGLERLSVETGVPNQVLRALPTYAGLAGVVGSDVATRVCDALPFEFLKIEDDRPAALRGALGALDGFVAHCGTGSFVAAQLEGETRLAGGWGAVLGDPASAQWVGRQCLSRTLLVADGLLQASDLSVSVLDRFSGTAEIVAFAARATPAELGALAPVVTEAARTDDPLAVSILQDAADTIVWTVSKMGWNPRLPICFTGGIGPLFVDYLPADMARAVMPKQADPLTGALLLARDFQKSIGDDW